MEAVLKSGKIVKGRLAEVYVNRSIATEIIKKKVLTANQVAEKIKMCNSIEELEIFESDDRQIVKAAYNKKQKEING